MITKRAQQIMVWQLRAVRALTGANYFHWNKEKNRFDEQRGYIRYNSNCLVAISFGYPLMMFLWLIYKRSGEDGLGSGIALTCHAIGWVELFIIIACQCVAYRLATNVSESITLINQLFQHSEYIHEMMIEQKLKFTVEIKRKNKICEMMMCSLFLDFLIIPPTMVIMITIPWEPNHALIKDLLEIDVKLQLSHIPFLVALTWLTTNIAGVLQLFATMIVASLQIVDVCISCMLPQNVKRSPEMVRQIRYEIETESWGTMKDDMIIQHVRSLQVVNLLMNKIYASLMMSSHHFCCLVIFVGMLYVVIVMPDEIIAGGRVACLFIAFILVLPVVAQYGEAELVGKNVAVVEPFLEKCKNMTSRRSVFRKTIVSVPRIRVELLYPYGSVGKDTFLQFCHNSLDNLMALLTM